MYFHSLIRNLLSIIPKISGETELNNTVHICFHGTFEWSIAFDTQVEPKTIVDCKIPL